MKITNMKELCSAIALAEGSKHEASIGDVREIMRVFSDLIIDTDRSVLNVFIAYSLRRINRRKKK